MQQKEGCSIEPVWISSQMLRIKFETFKRNSFRVVVGPVLYTIGLLATFWNMNSSAWAIWAAQAVRKKEWI